VNLKWIQVGTDSGAHATDTLALEMCALEAEFKEVEAEKESLEYLLKEKLEKMVQVEIEERVNLYRQQQLNGGSMMETVPCISVVNKTTCSSLSYPNSS